MKIEKIIYDTTRELTSVEDKLGIAVIFLFCYKLEDEKFAELLYTNNHESFLEELERKIKNYDVKLRIDLSNPNIRNSFYKTLEEVKLRYDKDGYYKALFNNDEYAKVVSNIGKSLSTMNLNELMNYKKEVVI